MANLNDDKIIIINDSGIPEFNNIDWPLLRKQKYTLIAVIEYLRESNVHLLVDDLNGIVHLIDEIQDYAVDVTGVDETQVFDLSDEED
jgi:hypothetical protein